MAMTTIAKSSRNALSARSVLGVVMHLVSVRAAMTGTTDWEAYATETDFPTVPEAGSSRPRRQPGCFLQKPLSWPCLWVCNPGVSSSPRKDTSCTGLEPHPRAPTLTTSFNLIASLKAPWPNTDTLGGGACIQKLEVEGQFNPQHPDGVDGHHCPTGRDRCYPLYIIRMWKLRLKVQNAQNGI